MKFTFHFVLKLTAIVIFSNSFDISRLRTINKIRNFKVFAIEDWYKSEGIKNEDVKLKFICEEGLASAALAKSAFKKGDMIFSMPLGLCLDTGKATAKFSSILNLSRLRTGQFGLLALLLLSEKALGSKSKYYEYIQTLDRFPPGILSWSAAELEELLNSTTRKMNSQFDAINDDLKYIENLRSLSLPSSIYNVDEFRWAVGIVKSQYVVPEQQPIIVPGMHFIDFDPLAENEPIIASAGMFGGKVVKILTDRSYESGDRVCMSLGLKSSAECLEDHGFVPEVDLRDCSCEIAVSIEEEVDKYPDDKVTILEDNGFRSSMQFDLLADPSSEIDPDLMRFLRLKLISGKDSFILESCFMSVVFRTLESPFSKANELAVCQYLLNFAEKSLAKVNTVASNEEDLLKCEKEDPYGIPFALSQLRIQERAALQETINKMSLNILNIQGPADKREYYQERRLRELDLLRPLDESEIVNTWEG
mmetsp:Transcript_12940/g.19464  ORF Transcript_12940/g.19464 Transcript_12940/m.19464 type:complete len:477 (-) Transcript_12940:22-1452(-)